jgi:hypothetical protein
VRHDSSQLAVAVQAGPRREVQLAVAVRGEERIRTQLTQLTIPVVQGLNNLMVCTGMLVKSFCTAPRVNALLHKKHHSRNTIKYYNSLKFHIQILSMLQQ